MQLLKSDWTEKLNEAIWAYNTTRKTTIGFTPYELAYGKKVMFPMNQLADLNLDLSSAQKERIQNLNALDEYQQEAFFHVEVEHWQRKT